MKTFQKPLTLEEEMFYLQEYKKGDLKAKDVLIERNLRLVAHVIKKYQGIEEELDDLISIGTVGLIKAVMTYDPEKGSRLATYAVRCIDNELLMMLRSRKKWNREISLYEPIGTDKEGNEIHLMDIVESNDTDLMDTCIQNERIEKLYSLLGKILTPQECEVLKYRYGLYGEKELTQRVIGKRLGISRSYVSRIEKNAILKLREWFLSS